MEKIKDFDPHDFGHVPEQKIDVAHANISAKVNKDIARVDGRHDPELAIKDAEKVSSTLKRMTGAEMKRAKKRERRLAGLEAKARQSQEDLLNHTESKETSKNGSKIEENEKKNSFCS